jgi:YVTN family beta-propeller protein
MLRLSSCIFISALLAACTAKEQVPQSETSRPPQVLVLVSNEGSGELSVIDAISDSVVARINVGTRPPGVRVSPDGRTVYVALSGSPRCPPTMPDEECAKLKVDKSKDGIGEVDVASRQLRRVLPGGSDPENFDLSPDGTRLYTSNEDANTASFIDVAAGTVLRTAPVGREPEGVAVSPDGTRV